MEETVFEALSTGSIAWEAAAPGLQCCSSWPNKWTRRKFLIPAPRRTLSTLMAQRNGYFMMIFLSNMLILFFFHDCVEQPRAQGLVKWDQNPMSYGAMNGYKFMVKIPVSWDRNNATMAIYPLLTGTTGTASPSNKSLKPSTKHGCV